MSIFKRALASIGIGSAKVDAHLEKAQFQPGEDVKGVIHIQGGELDQQVDNIYMHVMTQYEKEVDDKRAHVNGVVGGYLVSSVFTLRAGEQREIPFTFPLPYETPLTQGRTPVWIETGLDIPSAVDPKDTDRIEVLPSPLQSSVLEAVKSLGFQIRKVDCEESRLRRSHHFVQEFEFIPVTGAFRGRLDELEIVFVAGDADEIELAIQVDKRAAGLKGLFEDAMGLDERYIRLLVSAAEADSGALAARLQEIIHKSLR